MEKDLFLPVVNPFVIKKWLVKKGRTVNQGTAICSFQIQGSSEIHKFKSPSFGTVVECYLPVDETFKETYAVLIYYAK